MEKLKIDLREIIKKLDLVTKGVVSSKVVGGYKSKFRGHGLEFDSYRDYSSIEDSKNIDWGASLKAGKLLVKVYVEERNLEVFFLVDVSSSMVYGSVNKLKSEYAAEVVASLAYAILKARDSAGLALFNNGLVKRVPISRGKKQFYILSKNLINPYLYGGGYDLANALKFLISYLRKKVVVIIVSDFIGLKGEWRRYLEIAGSKFDVVGIMIRDPADRDLPDEDRAVILSDPYSNNQLLVVASKIKAHYSAYVREQENEIKEAFLKSGCDFIELLTDGEFTSDLVRFFRERKRRIRRLK